MLPLYILGGIVMLAASLRALSGALGRLARRDDCVECGHHAQLHDPVQGCIAASEEHEDMACLCRFQI